MPPLLRQDCDIAVCPEGLLAVAQPCWVKREAELGESCWFEQRFWHDSLRMDGANERKNEAQRNLRGRLESMYGLSGGAITRPADLDGTPKTVVLGTKALLAWLLHKRTSFSHRGNRDKSLQVVSFIRRAVLQAEKALTSLPSDQLPTVATVLGQLRVLSSGHIHVADLLDAESTTGAVLRAFPMD